MYINRAVNSTFLNGELEVMKSDVQLANSWMLGLAEKLHNQPFSTIATGDKEAEYIFYENYHIPWKSTNNFNENSAAEFRGKSDISCYVQSNASHPRWRHYWKGRATLCTLPEP